MSKADDLMCNEPQFLEVATVTCEEAKSVRVGDSLRTKEGGAVYTVTEISVDQNTIVFTGLIHNLRKSILTHRQLRRQAVFDRSAMTR